MNESFSTLLDLFSLPEFQLGFLLGALGLGALMARRQFTREQRGWAIALTLLVIFGIRAEVGWQPELVVGVTLMGLGGWLNMVPGSISIGRFDGYNLMAWLLIITGASTVGLLALDHANPQVILVTAVAAIAIGWSLSKWSNSPDRIALGPLFAITAFGIWTTVPDTELARLLLGVSVPMGLATLRPISARIFSAGGWALGGTVAWLVLWGGQGRSGSVIGGWACIGMIALLPLASRLHPGRRIAMWQLIGLHIVAVVIAARVFGLWDRAMDAAIASLLLAAVILVVIMLIDREPARAE